MPQGARELVLHHPLQPFAPARVRRWPTSRAVSVTRQAWHPAADALCGPRSVPAPWFADVLPAARTRTQDAAARSRCARFLADPAGQFLRQRMGLRLPDEIEVSDDLEPLTAPAHGLDRWHLQQAVFDACVRRR